MSWFICYFLLRCNLNLDVIYTVSVLSFVQLCHLYCSEQHQLKDHLIWLSGIPLKVLCRILKRGFPFQVRFHFRKLEPSKEKPFVYMRVFSSEAVLVFLCSVYCTDKGKISHVTYKAFCLLCHSHIYVCSENRMLMEAGTPHWSTGSEIKGEKHFWKKNVKVSLRLCTIKKSRVGPIKLQEEITIQSWLW